MPGDVPSILYTPGDEGAFVKIGAFIDASGATAGAERVVGAVNEIEGATGAAAESAKESGEVFDASVFRNRRNVGHLLRGLLEMREGGLSAIGGIATEAHIATEVFEGLLGPIGLFIGALSLAGSVGIPLFEHMMQGEEKAGEKIDDLSEKTGRLVDFQKALLDAALAADKLLEESDGRRITALQKTLALKQNQIDLDAQQQTAAEKAEALAQEKAGQTKAQREEIERHEAEKTAEEGGENKVKKAQTDLSGKREEIDAQKILIDHLRDRQADDARQLREKQDASASAQNFLNTEGIRLTETGELPTAEAAKKDSSLSASVSKIDQMREEIAAAQALLNDRTEFQRRERERDPNSVAAYEAQGGIDEAQRQLNEAKGKYEDIVAAPAAIKDYVDAQKKLNADIVETSGKITVERDKLDNLNTEFSQAQQSLNTATQDLANTRTANALKEGDADQATLREARDLNLKAALEKALTPDQKANAQRAIDQAAADDAAGKPLVAPLFPQKNILTPQQQSYQRYEADAQRLREELAQKGNAAPDTQRALLARLSDVEAVLDSMRKATPDIEAGLNRSLEEKRQTPDEALADARNNYYSGRIAKDNQQLALEELKAHAEAQSKEIENIKAQLAARPNHATLDPFVKAALALPDQTQEVSALQAIMASHLGELADGLVKTQAQLKTTKSIAENAFKKARAATDGIK